MKLLPQEKLNKSLDKALLKYRPFISEINLFKSELIKLLDHIDNSESEEFNKNLVSSFLTKAFYADTHFINTKERQDLVIHNGKTNKTSVGVIIEAKRPTNKADWLIPSQPNSKALQELVLYYLRERIEAKNIDIKYLIATNINEWYIIEASYFDKLFYHNKQLVKNYEEWRDGKKVTKDTALFYNDIAKPFIDGLADEVPCIYFNIREHEAVLRSKQAESNREINALFKILSPYHLLKIPFANDSNELDDKFYKELLHIIGLEEFKEGTKNIIRRKKENRNTASFLEKAIDELRTEGLHKVNDLKSFGDSSEEQYFNIGLELCITWINRILFLKLLEGQLIKYHRGDQQYRFLNSDIIPNFGELFTLFHRVLAVDIPQRTAAIQQKYNRVPYLNSSLFEISDLEDVTIKINAIDSNDTLEYLGTTILKEQKKKNEKLPTIDYLFQFLDAYDFASEDTGDTREDNKTLINASVLGKVFEKINGYKDGSIYTPGFITMYMSRQSIRLAVLQKFNEAKNWDCKDFDGLTELIEYQEPETRKQANDIINSLKICDPAVGSGHFLVSALNEIIAIKSDLKILQDINGKRLKEYNIDVVNDELIVTDEDNDIFAYNPQNIQSQLVQQTLFTEKQTLIENCLFGVDINPNSVKICRLRLWIELLKNAYYKSDGNLETLPNIDINIKCGNSLLSRFALDADLSKALKSIKYDVKSYRGFVNDYKNCKDREVKRGLQFIIDKIKADFRTEIAKNDPLLIKFNKASGELHNLLTQVKLFEDSKTLKANKLKQGKLEADINKWAVEIDEIKNNAIYKNAFEWRFEFPEVLNNNGDFEGFDVVIGNPPYVDLKGLEPLFVKTLFENYKSTENRINLYSIFIELGLRILKERAYFTFINPNSILMNSSYDKIRRLIFDNVFEIIKLPDNVFSDSDVKVETIIISFQNAKEHQDIDVIKFKHDQKINSIDVGKIEKQNKAFWKSFEELKYNIYLTSEIENVLRKGLQDTVPLNRIANFTLGITPYDKYRGHTEKQIKDRAFHSETKLNDDYKPLIAGENIQRFYIDPAPKEYIKYGNWLGAPREEKFFIEPRVVVRQIVSGNPLRIYAGYTDQPLYFTQIGFSIIPQGNISPKYLTAILNSSLINFIHKYLYLDIEKELFQKILIENCKQLPIKVITAHYQRPFIDIVEEIIKAKRQSRDTAFLEKQIDALVYQLYDLTPDEIKIVECSGKANVNEPETI